MYTYILYSSTVYIELMLKIYYIIRSRPFGYSKLLIMKSMYILKLARCELGFFFFLINCLDHNITIELSGHVCS